MLGEIDDSEVLETNAEVVRAGLLSKERILVKG
jgi:hypothetical protein